MARLRYNGLSNSLGAALTSGGTTITFASKLTYAGGDVPTITGSDYIPLSILDADGKCAEVVHLTAYTSAATTGTIARGKEDTSGVAHDSGVVVVNGPTVGDVGFSSLLVQDVNDPLTSASGFTTHSGTWSVSTYLQVATAAGAQCRAICNTKLSLAGINIVECEIEVPASGFSSSAEHIKVGWGPASNTGLGLVFGMRGDGQAYLERDGTVALNAQAYTIPSAGTWVTCRLVTVGQSASGYINGTRYVAHVDNQGAGDSGLAPRINTYKGSGSMTVRFRNFKAWSLAVPSSL